MPGDRGRERADRASNEPDTDDGVTTETPWWLDESDDKLMARSRLLKPGFFQNEELADIPFAGRLLFQGLWLLADREGRLEDRPRRIKAEILPYDDVDAEGLLTALADHEFIIRYEHGGQRFIQVVAFTKHQSPHINEAPSTIQAPEGYGASTVQAPEHSPLLLVTSTKSSSTTPPISPPTGGKPKPKRVPLSDDERQALVKKYAPQFGSEQNVRDEIDLAMNHQARSKNFVEKLYVDGWLRRTVERMPTHIRTAAATNGHVRDISKHDRTGQAI